MLSLLFTLALTISALAEPEVLQAKFLGIEIGDYYHINLEDAEGNQHSFFLSGDESFQQYIENPESYVNSWVKLQWHSVQKDIPEAGGMMEIKEAISIEEAEDGH